MKATLKIEGLKEFDAALGELTKATAKNVLKRAATQAALPMAQRMRELVPVRIGRLRDSIGITALTTGGQAGKAAYAAAKQAGASDDDAGEAAHRAASDYANDPSNAGKGVGVVVSVGPTGRWARGIAHLIEFGTVHHQAHPFIRPAFDQTKDEVVSRIAGSLKIEIDAAAARAARKALKKAGG